MRKVSLLLLALLVSACLSAKKTQRKPHKQAVHSESFEQEEVEEFEVESGFGNPLDVEEEEFVAMANEEDEQADPTTVSVPRSSGPVSGVESPIYKLAQRLLEDSKNRVTPEERQTWGRAISSFEHKFNGKIFVVIGHSGTETHYDEIISKLRNHTVSETADDKLESDFAEVRAALKDKCGGQMSKYTAFVKLTNHGSRKGTDFQAQSRLALVHCQKGLTQVAFSNILTIRSTFKDPSVSTQDFAQFCHRYFQFAFLRSFTKACIEEFVTKTQN